MNRYPYVLIACGILSFGCAREYEQPRLSRVDPTVGQEDIGTSGFAINEVLEIAAYMMPRMRASPLLNQSIAKGEQNPDLIPKIVILPVKNNTRFALNKGVFMNRLRSELNKKALGKIFFLARENIDDLQSERQLRGESGITTADYFLTGTIDGMTAAGSRGGSQESYLYSFRLIDTRNDIIIWEDNYIISKIAMERLINR